MPAETCLGAETIKANLVSRFGAHQSEEPYQRTPAAAVPGAPGTSAASPGTFSPGTVAADGVLDSVTTSVFEAHELIKKTRNNNHSPCPPEIFIPDKSVIINRVDSTCPCVFASEPWRWPALGPSKGRTAWGPDGLGAGRLHQGDFFLKIWSQFVPLGDGGVALLAAPGEAAPIGLAAAATV